MAASVQERPTFFLFNLRNTCKPVNTMMNGNEPICPNMPHYGQGLTIRQYFAARAMQGLLTQTVTPVLRRESDEYKTEPVFKTPYLSSDGDVTISELASDAVAIADALIEELNKEKVDAKGKVY